MEYGKLIFRFVRFTVGFSVLFYEIRGYRGWFYSVD